MTLPTNLVLPKALRFHNQLFHLHMKHSPYPVIWNSESGRLEVSQAFPQGSSWFYVTYFNIFFVAGIIGFGSCLDVVCHYSDENIGQEIIVLSAVFGALSVFFWASVYVLICDISDFVTGYRRLQNHFYTLSEC